MQKPKDSEDVIEIYRSPLGEYFSLYYIPNRKILLYGNDDGTLPVKNNGLKLDDAIGRIFRCVDYYGAHSFSEKEYLAVQKLKKLWTEEAVRNVLSHETMTKPPLFTISETPNSAGVEYYFDSSRYYSCRFSMHGEDLGFHTIGVQKVVDDIMALPEDQQKSAFESIVPHYGEKTTLERLCREKDGDRADIDSRTMQKLGELAKAFFDRETDRNPSAEEAFMVLLCHLLRGYFHSGIYNDPFFRDRFMEAWFPDGTKCPCPGELIYSYSSGYESCYDGGCGGGSGYTLELRIMKLKESWPEAIVRHTSPPSYYQGKKFKGFMYAGELPFGKDTEVCWSGYGKALLLKDPCGLRGVYLLEFLND